MPCRSPKIVLLALIAVALESCSGPAASQAMITPSAAINPTMTALPTLSPAPSLTPTVNPASTNTPSPTSLPLYLPATVWPEDPEVAVLVYHRFLPDTAPYSTTTKMRLKDFRIHLQRLYDAGYSLIPLEDWLNGNLTLPAGRRPLILTMDDLFFADQIFLNEEGQPSTDSGIGVLWQFSQEHPDFGFSVALFANLGDKDYANEEVNGRFLLGKDWQDSLAKVIVWCLEHNAFPYNHTFTHPRLDLTPANVITWELRENDDTLRSFLARAGREDLVSKLDNLVALPYSIWPTSEGEKKLLETYISPEGKPVQAIFEADYAYRPKYMPAPYSAAFDRYHLPRMEGLNSAIDLLETKKDLFPPVSTCQVGPLDDTQLADTTYLASQVMKMVDLSRCTAGVYAFQGQLFRVSAGNAEQLKTGP
ncbi:MAG: hypothetical protein ABSB61_10000 [Anaerolineales bacterium]